LLDGPTQEIVKKQKKKQTFLPEQAPEKKVKTSSQAQGYTEVQPLEDHSTCL
jgi:hypothetical protein